MITPEAELNMTIYSRHFPAFIKGYVFRFCSVGYNYTARVRTAHTTGLV